MNREHVLEAKEEKIKESAKVNKKKQQIDNTPKGRYLKKVREEKGLSLDTVHEATKIPLDALRGIEEGYTVRTLSSFYVKGFLKIYAQFLDVDITKVVEDYKTEELPSYIKQDVEDFNIAENVSKFLTKKRKQQIVIACGAILFLALLFFIISFFGRLSKDNSKDKSRQTVKKVLINPTVEKKTGDSKPKVTITETVKPKNPVSSPAVPAATVVSTPVNIPPQQPAAAKAVILTIRAQKPSWLRVKSDGAVVFQSTLREGAVETWRADDNIVISGKNLNQLEFELNGNLFGTLGRKDRKAKELIVTKDGLKVTK